ncbi:hypothetical protein [Runella limosa]|uniref:hypothetical protein n=1 Tax=Runella limosa TaxID=370978 RepID=UPI0003F7F2FA|nr:hypothetical protein [Runella limosa]
MEWREKTIQNVFGGDEKRFEQAYQEAVKEAISEAISWKDLALNATVLPDWESATKDLIERRLGYLPHPAVSLPFEPYLRALLQQYRQGILSSEAFTHEAEAHIQLIRNADMAHYAFTEAAPHFVQSYQKMVEIFGLKAKERLTRFLGYEPRLEHSLMAELWLYDLMIRDTIRLPAHLTAVDFKALTIVRYREHLLTQGQAAAEASPLLGTFSAV